MKSLSTLIGIMLLIAGTQAGAGDFGTYTNPYADINNPYSDMNNPYSYSYQSPRASYPSIVQPYSYQPYQAPPEYNAYDYAMDLVEKDIKRSGRTA